jgi:hypothetical protein
MRLDHGGNSQAKQAGTIKKLGLETELVAMK